jgi:protein-tyrosine phosphatase
VTLDPRLVRLAALLALPTAFWACNPGNATRETTSTASAAPIEGHVPGLQRLHRWSDRILQGEAPASDTCLAELADLGVTTVLSVDGAVPDVERAARFGLAYVHVPVGYDGITPDEQARIVKAATDSPGPIYIHCHHGLHRGPAAAAIARIAVDGVSREDAYKGLEESGCSPAYDGLFAAVKDFVPPSAETLAALPPLPSAVKPQGIQDGMVHADERWSYVEALKAANWIAPADAPDKTPAHELTILREVFREIDRLDEAQAKGDDFLAHSSSVQQRITELQSALGSRDAAACAAAFDALKADCKSCHVAYRD